MTPTLRISAPFGVTFQHVAAQSRLEAVQLAPEIAQADELDPRRLSQLQQG